MVESLLQIGVVALLLLVLAAGYMVATAWGETGQRAGWRTAQWVKEEKRKAEEERNEDQDHQRRDARGDEDR